MRSNLETSSFCPSLRRSVPTLPLALLWLVTAACSSERAAERVNRTADPVVPRGEAFTVLAGREVESDPREKRLRNLRQLTFGGENAEAYWSSDGTKLVMQTRHSPTEGDQIFTLDLVTGQRTRISTGTARTTCAYFLQGDERIVFASTHGAGPQVPMVKREPGLGYVWGVFTDYDLWVADLDGGNLMQLTDSPGYDAEATVCPVTGTILFTSVRDGDLELYTMEPDGTDVRRITDRLGYDGGAFFSHDGSKIVQRSGFLKSEEDTQRYQGLLARGLVAPSAMEITVIDRDGSNFRQVTDNGKANFAPYWLPDNRRILFASNMNNASPRDRNFDLFLIHEDGTGLEQVTFHPEFDSFPMFSPDGNYVVFASNRFGAQEGDTNVFLAEWVD